MKEGTNEAGEKKVERGTKRQHAQQGHRTFETAVLRRRDTCHTPVQPYSTRQQMSAGLMIGRVELEHTYELRAFDRDTTISSIYALCTLLQY